MQITIFAIYGSLPFLPWYIAAIARPGRDTIQAEIIWIGCCVYVHYWLRYHVKWTHSTDSWLLDCCSSCSVRALPPPTRDPALFNFQYLSLSVYFASYFKSNFCDILITGKFWRFSDLILYLYTVQFWNSEYLWCINSLKSCKNILYCVNNHILLICRWCDQGKENTTGKFKSWSIHVRLCVRT